MHSAFQEVTLSGIIEPGDTYLLTEDDRRYNGYTSDLYAIRKDEEILRALDMTINIICAEGYETREFLEIKRISDNGYLLRVLCYDKQSEREVVFTYSLERLRSFQEELTRVKEAFGVE